MWIAGLVAGFAAATVASAHSGGNGARVSQKTILRLKPETITIEHVLRLNRPAAFLEVTRMDADGDGELRPEERKRYFKRVDRALANSLSVRVNGEAADLESVGEVELEMPFTKRYRFKVSQPEGWERGAVFEFHNDSYLATSGAVRIRVEAAEAVRITDSSLSEEAGPEASSATAPKQRDVVLRYRGDEKAGDAVGYGATEDGRRTDAAPGTPGRTMVVAVVAAGAVLFTACGLFFRGRGFRLGAAVAAMACGASAGTAWAAWPTEADPPMARAEAKQLFRELHRNVYDAFSATTERALYDRLDDSLDGELLHQVYGEIYPLLFGPSSDQGDLSIDRVRPVDTRVTRLNDGPAFRVTHRWRVYGTVRHFRHSHPRFHEYEATYRVAERAGRWRLVDMDVVQQRRIVPEKAGLATLRPTLQRAATTRPSADTRGSS